MKQEKKQKYGGSALTFIWQNSFGMKRWFLLAVLTALVSIVANYAVPQVIRFTVDSIIGNEPSALPGFINGWLEALGGREVLRANLVLCASGIAIASLVAGLFNFASRGAIATATEHFSKRLRDTLYRHIQYLPFKWHVDNQTGDIIQRCTADLDVVRNFVSSQLLEVVRTCIQMGIAMALLFAMNWKLALIALSFVPVILGYSYIFYRIIAKRFLKADEAEGALTVAVQENLTGVRVVRAFGRERYEMRHFDKFNEGFAELWMRLGGTLGAYWAIGDIVTGLQLLTVIAAGCVFAAAGELTLGEFLVFVSYNQSLAWPVRSLGRTLSEMSKTGVSAARIQMILDAEEEAEEPNAQKPGLAADIEFEHVTFTYGGQPVLQDASFTIKAGTTFGILGPTGSGKSTMTYLLDRLYDLPEGCGAIRIGGVDIRDIDRHWLRRNVGVVLQQPFLFSKTIRENIAVARPESSFEEVRAAAATAAVDGAIMDFAQGYDTVVGERGVTLSGGQKQRVAIARTLMMKAPIMVFDDSLSAVDLDTDAQIRASLRQDTEGATVILIGHRINTLMAADQILVLEDGKVADIGSHGQLIHRPGLYKRIYDMQAQAAVDGFAAGRGGVPE